MSLLYFYREQAARQQSAADAATLQNARDRCQRAANAWTALASRSERGGTRPKASDEPPAGPADMFVDDHADRDVDQGDRS